ncbi:hypothetical protein AALP_AA1G178600 [Arabis alpina]|uniref:Uncharacterized protein n=1 Tax=Arabis alpina TaxID=50452 RepID=A0A087HNX2_ARAAL|nr:hypothetical protein AALP_AA1G178600 [Arabis alpina]
MVSGEENTSRRDNREREPSIEATAAKTPARDDLTEVKKMLADFLTEQKNQAKMIEENSKELKAFSRRKRERPNTARLRARVDPQRLALLGETQRIYHRRLRVEKRTNPLNASLTSLTKRNQPTQSVHGRKVQKETDKNHALLTLKARRALPRQRLWETPQNTHSTPAKSDTRRSKSAEHSALTP